MIIMKKYNTPVIEALALETIDVIAASGEAYAATKLAEQLSTPGAPVDAGDIEQMGQDIARMGNSWSW